MSNRYDTTGNPEGQYQPGSNNQVLLNKLGITNPDEMDDVELELLKQLTTSVLAEIEDDQLLITYVNGIAVGLAMYTNGQGNIVQ